MGARYTFNKGEGSDGRTWNAFGRARHILQQQVTEVNAGWSQLITSLGSCWIRHQQPPAWVSSWLDFQHRWGLFPHSSTFQMDLPLVLQQLACSRREKTQTACKGRSRDRFLLFGFLPPSHQVLNLNVWIKEKNVGCLEWSVRALDLLW